MADSYDELLDLSEFDGHSTIAKFIHRDDSVNEYAKTWDYYAWSYARGFDELARLAFEGRRGNFTYPIYFLARHSIELALKTTILEYADTDDTKPDLESHNLLTLWDQLGGYMTRWGVPADDDWGRIVRSQIEEIHQADPRGDRFRYPQDIKGRVFDLDRVELEGLVRAHNSITSYLDGSATMHAESYRG